MIADRLYRVGTSLAGGSTGLRWEWSKCTSVDKYPLVGTDRGRDSLFLDNIGSCAGTIRHRFENAAKTKAKHLSEEQDHPAHLQYCGQEIAYEMVRFHECYVQEMP